MFSNYLNSLEQPAADFLDLAMAIQQIPAPTFGEAARAEFVRRWFEDEGLAAAVDDLGNVLACWPGAGAAAPLVISAHLDTVFPRETDLALRLEGERLYGPGLGDNSTGVAGLLYLARWLKSRPEPFPGDIWLAANTGEEGLGDLSGMWHLVRRFGGQARAYIVLEGMALGQVYWHAVGVKRFRVTATGPGGHSWVEAGRPSAIHALAEVIHHLAAIPLARTPRTSLNVGTIQGGTSVNTIAAEASFDLDLRSEAPQGLLDLSDQAAAAVAQARQRYPQDIEIRMEKIGDRPAGEISRNHPLVQAAVRILEALGLPVHLNSGSTDANAPLSLNLPAICIGLTHGGGAHTLGEFIEIPPLKKGLLQLTRLVEAVFEIPHPPAAS